ncbi:hypothetical protein ACLOJK_032264 [Asimina triloba]
MGANVRDKETNVVFCIFGNLGRTEFMESYVVEWSAAAETARQPPVPHPSSSTTNVRRVLPVLLYKDWEVDGELQDTCAFCLCGFEAEEEIRRLTNCRHIFHRPCLDRWIDHDQITCPLCRTCFVTREMMGEMDSQFWATAEADSDILSEYSFTLGSYN